MAWKVGDIKQWLKNKNIAFEEKSKKKSLITIVKELNIPKRYAVDKIIKESGHIPLRTPPYCCEVCL